MKISNSIRELYQNQYDIYHPLSKKVDEVFFYSKEARWHYESRLKTAESFALKLETGRFLVPSDIEDFFACTIVVENLTSISNAEKLIRDKFNFKERRPKTDDFTYKGSESFPFDDLRLYVTWKDEHGQKPSGFDGKKFEIQIKTFLQHAWSIATHDLIYKTNEKDWPKERIPYQIKAMLEHAEISIYEANNIAKSAMLHRENKQTQKIKKIISMVNTIWDASFLPFDVKRLAENIYELLTSLKLNTDDLSRFIDKETALGRGKNTLNLSPYGIIIQTLFNQAKANIYGYLQGAESSFKILVHKDIDIPSDIDISRSKNVIIVD